MIFTRIALATFALLSSLGMASGSGVMIGFEHRGVTSVFSTISVADSKLNKLLSEAGGWPIVYALPTANLGHVQQPISSCKDISISVAMDMSTFKPGSDIQLIIIGPDGNKLSLAELGEAYRAYQKSVKIDDTIQEIVLHMSMTHDDMERLFPEVVNMSAIVDTNRATQNAATIIIDSMLSPVE
ncbi:hypothetical protein B0J17DRAFT_625496 [Rhizoctonia solani]|nr:hypothetical protein B0J17DRAFT_625496 [Rhizoctonia solani]